MKEYKMVKVNMIMGQTAGMPVIFFIQFPTEGRESIWLMAGFQVIVV